MYYTSAFLVGLLIAALVIFHVYSAAVATWHLNRAEHFTHGQKLAQRAIIWLFPIIGVAFVLSVLGQEHRKRRPGWIPILEPLVLAAFIHSGSGAGDDASHDDTSTESTPSYDGGGDGVGD